MIALEPDEIGIRPLARAGHVDVEDLLHRAGPGGHDHDPVGEEDRLRDRAGDEDHALAVLLPDPQQGLPHGQAGGGDDRRQGRAG
ncbi:hypothetical protein ACFQY5_20350 [Paeniroseomonas aquatica]|uniref:Uncharacterized protein n=1 Tax=Paeniroseomonas aquatica TaxID=373043 RepID=A0ABT8ABW3_9PROT|nr:hypothetical protein [Paeniroseomonas aquatica]MDN3567170.1 hypothetical protein [Paeniroseomonas aquatica]